MDFEIRGMRGSDALGVRQCFGDADGVGIFRDPREVAEAALQQLHQRQPGHPA